MVYIDSDGVLADFDKWVLDKDPSLKEKYDRGEYPLEIFKILADFWEEAYENFEVVESNKYLLEYIKTRDDFRILTALPSKKYMLGVPGVSKELLKLFYKRYKANKRYWFSKLHIPDDKVIIVEDPEEKQKICKPGDILIDDFEKNCEQWRKLGGISVHLENKYLKK